jgi:hypothetical protein
MIKNNNDRFYDHCGDLREKGKVSIGSFLRIVDPLPISSTLGGIPIVKSLCPAIALKMPTFYHPVAINRNLQRNMYGISVQNNVMIDVLSTNFVKTACVGYHCDRQRAHNLESNQGCGCFHHGSRLGVCNLAVLNQISIDGGDFHFFSSLKFATHVFQTKNFPPSTNITSLEDKRTKQAFKQAVRDCIGLINLYGGFTVVMWYSRGTVDDMSMNNMNVSADQATTNGGNLNYHISQIIPTDRAFLKSNYYLYDLLHDLKFDVDRYNL